jgi:hypothetical protein
VPWHSYLLSEKRGFAATCLLLLLLLADRLANGAVLRLVL